MLLNDAGNVTLRNGLTSREREQRVGRIVAAAVGAYLLLCFLVPLVLPEGTVPEPVSYTHLTLPTICSV